MSQSLPAEFAAFVQTIAPPGGFGNWLGQGETNQPLFLHQAVATTEHGWLLVHTPLEQTSWPGQTLPQAPQLFLSAVTSAHVPLQYSLPVEQQWPAVHHSVSTAHAVMQLPQCSWLFCVS